MVNELNESMKSLVKASVSELSDSFEGRVDRTFDQVPIWIQDDAFLSPKAKLYIPFGTIDVIFFERLTSYTRTFDMTLIMGSSHFSISTIQRKKYFKMIQKGIKSKKTFETGPDPIPWDMAMKRHKDGISWEDIHSMITNIVSEEEEVSEWSPGNTDDETDDEEDYPEDDLSEVNELESELESDEEEQYSDVDDEVGPPLKKIKV